MAQRGHSVIAWGEHGKMFEIKVVLETLGRFGVVYMLFKGPTIDFMHKVNM